MIFKLGYLIILAIVIAVEHTVFDSYPELIRRGMGIITVMGLSFGLVLVNAYESALDCWLWTFFGFGQSGAILIMMKNYTATHTRENAVNQLKALRENEQNIES